MTEAQATATAMQAGEAILSMCDRASIPWRYAVAGAALASLPDWAFDKLIDSHVEARRFGPPSPPWQSLIDEARDWASWLSAPELEAYAQATFNALPGAKQVAMIDALMRARRAA